MKFIVRSYGRKENEFRIPDEIGDMFLYLTGLMNTLPVKQDELFGGKLAEALGKTRIEIERTE